MKDIVHRKLINFVKYNRTVLGIYRFFGNALVYILKLFCRIDDKKILFMAFGGQKYDDSPRAIYEAINKDPYFFDYKLVWAFTDPKNTGEDGMERVKVDTFSFFFHALTSRVWITNSSVERGLDLKCKGTIEVNTWHGTPLKKLGEDIVGNNVHGKFKAKKNIIYCAQSEYDRDIFSRLFHVDKEHFIVKDLPRNDSLLRYTDERIKEIKTYLGIPEDKKVILYAPTFREYDRDAQNACYIKPPINMHKWEERLGDNHVVLFRAHYEIVRVMGIECNEFIKDVSDYTYLNDLFAVSDMLISDYSSMFFDYSIVEKPMLCFAYDLEVYLKERGLYLDPEEIFPNGVAYDEDELILKILKMDVESSCRITADFKARFAPNAGHATEAVVSKIKELIVK